MCAESVEQAVDNRDLVDDQASQNLSHEDVERMKAEGLSGRAIIQSLMQNSDTFEVVAVTVTRRRAHPERG